MAETCFNPSCSDLGTHTCSACKTAKYCSPKCQRSHWSAHKAACKATSQANAPPKANCYILRAAPHTPTAPVLQHIARQIEPFTLSNYGNERAERRQLEQRLGWRGCIEVGKFYDHLGCDRWYYYVYGDARAFEPTSGLPINEVAGLVCHRKLVYGDIAILRSGPVGSEYAEEFSKTELAKAVEFYKSNDRDQVFSKREMSRTMRSFGMPEGSWDGVPHVHMEVD